MYKVYPIESKEKWESFLEKTIPRSFLQSWNWGEFNQITGTEILRLGIFKENQLKGVCLVLTVKAKRGIHLLCPHGPELLDWKDADCFNALLDYLKNVAEQKGASFIRICPSVLLSEESIKVFKKHKFKPSPIHTHPELAWLLDISVSEAEILKEMRKNTRYAIRKAERDGVAIEQSNKVEDVQNFFKLYAQTASQQNFTPFSLDFLEKEFQTFSSDDQALWFFARYRGEIVAGALVIFAYQSVFYHHGASISVPGVSAPHLMQWEIIQEARRRGKKLYNFWGIAPESASKKHPWSGFTFFKKSFGGFSEEYIPSQDLVLKNSYWLNFIVESIRKIKRGF